MRELAVVDLTKRFGRVRALAGVSFKVRGGEYVAVTGPVGAGKTTLLKVIAGLLEPDSGDVLVDGQSVLGLAPEERNFSYMPSGQSLFPHMTVYDNVAYGPRARGLSEGEVAERVRRALELVGLWHRRSSLPHELSGGMRQRVALARALASGADLLLLDEPLSALDLLLNIELRHELRRLAKSLGLTVIHVTHNFEEAMAVADRILVLRSGVVQQYGTPEEVYLRPANLFVASFSGDLNVLEGSVMAARDGCLVVELNGLGELLVEGHGFRVGERVVVAYRPEALLLSREQLSGPNAFPGRIVELRFLGPLTTVELEVGGAAVVARLPSHEASAFGRSELVYVHMPPGRALVYPYPRAGLAKALAV